MPLTPKGDSYQLVAYFDPATGNIVIPGGGSGGGGGGAETVADGADVALGSRSDAAWNLTDAVATLIQIAKSIALNAGSTNPVSVAGPSGALMLDATGTSILNALKAQIDFTSLFVTNGTSYYVRRESVNEGTGAISVAFENLDGTAATPTGTLTPILGGTSGGTKIGEPAYYVCTAIAAGIAVNDVLAHVVIYDTAAGTASGVWLNVTQSTTLATAPIIGTNCSLLPQTTTPAASELHLGEIGGNIAKAAQAFGPASSTTYTAGQVILGTTALANMARVANGTGYLFGATLALNALNTAQVDLFIFATQPAGTYTAGATFTLTAADQAKLSKVIHLDDWTAAGAAASFGQPLDKGPRLFRCDDATATQSLWAVAVARGSITLVAATDGNLSVRAARN